MALDSKKVCKSLIKKGFVEEQGDHRYFNLIHEGKQILHTKVSHNNQDINEYLIAQMKRQCHLEKKDFLDLINCPLTHDNYIKKLKEKGTIQ